jgi:hypothetical protein
MNRKIYSPGGVEDMIGEEGVGKVEHVLRILVFDGADPPGESCKGEDRVDIEGKLGCVSACACEHGDEAINSGDFVEYGEKDNNSDARLEVKQTEDGSKRTWP